MSRDYLPKYVKVRNLILAKIDSGILRKGDMLPPEPILAQELGVGRVTIISAMKQLVEEGIIVRKKHIGSIVNVGKIDRQKHNIFDRVTPPPQTTIRYWLTDSKPRHLFMLQTLAGIFQIENSDVKVIVERNPYEHEFYSGIPANLNRLDLPAAGNLYLTSPWGTSGALVALDRFPDFQEVIQPLYPHVLRAQQPSTGHVFGLHSKFSLPMVIVNTDLLHAAGIRDLDVPLTSELLLSWIDRLSRYVQAMGNGTYAYFHQTPSKGMFAINSIPYLWQGIPDRDFSSVSASCFHRMFHTPEALAGLTFLESVHRYPNAPDNGIDLFAIGKVGILLAGSPWVLTLSEMLQDPIPMRFYPYPLLPGQKSFHATVGSATEVIFRQGIKSQEELNAAWRWIKFLLSKETQFWLSSDYTLPANQNSESIFQERYPDVYEVETSCLQRSRSQFDFDGVYEALEQTGTELEQLFKGTISAAQCLKRLQAAFPLEVQA